MREYIYGRAIVKHRKPWPVTKFEGIVLSDVYAHFSSFKRHAYSECMSMVEDMGAHYYGILSHNTMMFVFGLYYVDENGKNRFARVTPNYIHLYPAA